MKITIASFGLLFAVLAIAGCAQNNPKNLPPGQYETHSKSIDSEGTERNRENSTKVYYDANGNKKAILDQKTTTDPKGLFNKNTTETHESME